MRIIELNPNGFSSEIIALHHRSEVSGAEVAVLGGADLLRALLCAVRETSEEVPDEEFMDRIGASAQEVAAWEVALNEIYDAVTETHPPTPWPHRILAKTLLPSSPEMSDPPIGTLVLGMEERERAAYVSILRVTLDEVEDWEYGTRMGFDREPIQELIDHLS